MTHMHAACSLQMPVATAESNRRPDFSAPAAQVSNLPAHAPNSTLRTCRRRSPETLHEGNSSLESLRVG